MNDWTYQEALAEMHERKYGKEIRIMYEDGLKKEIARRREEQTIVTEAEIKTAVRDDLFIKKDIGDHGIDADLPPSVVRMYAEYREKQEKAQDDAHIARLREEQILRMRLQAEDLHIRYLQRMGFSVQNYLNSKVYR